MGRTVKVYLNIDFDFFVEEHPEWDFQHSETSLHMDILWGLRAADMQTRGISLLEKMDASKCNPPPSSLAYQLGKSLNFDKAKLIVAESHAYGFKGFRKQELIVNLDAHHDLGYHSAAKLKQWAAKGHWEAGSWLGSILRQTEKTKALVVYPEWRGFSEWISYRKRLLSTDMLYAKARAALYPHQGELEPEMKMSHTDATTFVVDSVFICRSGAWVPPWNDHLFVRFVESMSHLTKGGMTVIKEHRDPLEVRPFDKEQVEALARDITAMHEKLRR